MILNIILLLLALGWTVNVAVFVVRVQLSAVVLNVVLASAAAVTLMVRLS